MERNGYRLAILVLTVSLTACGAPNVEPSEPARVAAADDVERSGDDASSPQVALECTFADTAEQRYRRDCQRELEGLREQEATLQQQMSSLDAGTLTLVRDALTRLVDQRRQLCHDWNACALSRDAHMARYDWVSDELATLTRLLTDSPDRPSTRDAELRTWANELSSRRPTLGGAASPTPSGVTSNDSSAVGSMAPGAKIPAPPGMSQEMMEATAEAQASAQRRLKVVFVQQQRELVELEAFQKVVSELRAASTPPSNGGPPPLCAKAQATRTQLTELVRGPNSIVNSMARSLLDGVNDICGPYELWAQPDERVQGQIDRLFAHVDRVDGWMTEILACINPGPYDYPCRNAFGSLEPGDEAQARKTQKILKQVRRELRGVKAGKRRFPCNAPLWRSLQQQQWNESVSRAQMPGLGRSAERICKTIGIDQEGLEKSRENFTRRLDSSESTLSSHIRSRQEALARMGSFMQ